MLELRIGGRTYKENQLADIRLSMAVNDDAKMSGTIADADTADLGAELQLVHVDGDDRTSRFSGWVSVGTPEANVIRIVARSGPWLDEGRLPGWTCQGVSEDEMVWTLGRLGGLASEMIDIPGYEPTTARFLVAVPVAGIGIDDDIVVGQIGITRAPTPSMDAMLAFVGDEQLRLAFLSAGVWAFVGVSGHTLLDAELAGRSAIEPALDRAALDLLFPAVGLPDGRRRPFDRANMRSDPRSLPLALVSGSDGRRWCRSLEPWVFDLPPARTSQNSLRLPSSGPAQFDAALAAWRRALRSFDPIRKAVAIWEALEHYTEGTRPGRLFTRPQRKEIARRALQTPDLTDDQRERVSDVLGHLNDPTAIRKLKVAAAKEGFACTPEEFEAAEAIRKARTSGVHGTAFEGDLVQLEKQLDVAIGFTARLLAHWGNQISSRNNAGTADERTGD